MRLLIAEKPSAARNFARVIGATYKREGYMEGNGYIVSWCLGHLAELADAESYDEKYTKWRREDLPILPETWQFSCHRDKKKQLDLLCSLMKWEDVTEIINACDAGREGELIFRTVYNLAGCDKPVKRLWTSSMEDTAILDGMEHLRDGREFDNLYQAALCRSRADWLVGINATRLFSVLYHRTLNVGRVLSPTLAMLTQREAEIDAFVPESYWSVRLDFGSLSAVSGRYAYQTNAEAAAEALKASGAVVKSIVKTEKAEKAPQLYDLTALQRDANRILGYTAQQTLDYLQSLYEMKLCTYPRTDSRYLTDDMAAGVQALALCAAGICGEILGNVCPEQVCDSKKVSDHPAITPTLTAGESDLSALPSGEREILLMIARRVLCAVSGPYVYEETTVKLECEDTEYAAAGKTTLFSGWRAYAGQMPRDDALPELVEGQRIHPDAVAVTEGKTTPPGHFTEDTLLAAMERAGVKEMAADVERKGLGTPATRAAILEKLVSAGFMERKKNRKTVSLLPTKAGMSLTAVMPEALCSPLLTAEWENKLLQIEHGELAPETFMTEITEMVKALVRDYEIVAGSEVLFPSGRPVVGKCPRCGCDVTESKLGFFCERNDCRFGLWKDNKYLAAKHVILTRKMAEALLRDGRAFSSGLYSEKTGKAYDAYVVLEDDGTRSTYRIELEKKG